MKGKFQISNFKYQISNKVFYNWRLKIGNSKFVIPASQEGFTLVELLVVIAIIGVLSALLMSNFIAVRQRARDTQRKSDLRQIQSALELYRSDAGYYPSSLPCGSSLVNGSSTYMSKVPCDPLSSQTYNNGNYSYVASGTPPSSYTLVACLENGNDNDSSTQGSDPNSSSSTGSCSTSKYFVVTNP